MKTLKYIAIIFIFLVICLVVFSRIFRNIHYKTEVTINVPVQKVFTGYMDIEKMGRWIPGFERIEYMGGLMMGKGTRLRLVLNNNGKQTTAIQEIKQIKWNKLIEYTLDEKRITVSTTVLFTQEDGSTIVITENEAHGNGFLWKTLLPFMKPAISVKARKSQEMFKAAMEKDFS
ncbi:MAG: SRPBCC family protein [Bacteroidales bacterium]|nr:SRPBCC family protein [Bacteroidales bacterium]